MNLADPGTTIPAQLRGSPVRQASRAMAMAGWYGDPLGLHEKRFFNGVVWTDRVRMATSRAGTRSGTFRRRRPYADRVGRRPAVPGAATARSAIRRPSAVRRRAAVRRRQPQQVGNGFAVAALTLGIIGVVFAGGLFGYIIGMICGVLALVFGIVGRHQVTSRARPWVASRPRASCSVASRSPSGSTRSGGGTASPM